MRGSSNTGILMNVAEFIESQRETSLAELCEFLRIPSVSAKTEHKPDIERAARWVRDKLRAAGLKTVQIVPTNLHPLVYAEWTGAPGKPTILFYGHYDVQPPDPLDEWKSPPFEPQIRGNDIFAPRGTPVIAPFDGIATVDAGGLGGNGVMVTGKDGYVYNAHLEAYGTLGAVKTGQVIGYVGNSGDAAGGATHDHFEWHPYHPTLNWVSPYGYRVVGSSNPPGVDPYPYLRAACS